MAKSMHNPVDARNARTDRGPSYLWTGHGVLELPYHITRKKGLPPNWHFFFTLSGRALFKQSGKEHPIRAGDVVLLGPDCEHDYGCVPGVPWEFIFAYFTPRPEWLEWMKLPRIGAQLNLLHIRSGAIRARLRAAMFRAHEYMHSTFGVFADELAMSALEEALVLVAHENTYAQGPARRLSEATAEALRFIEANLARPLSVPALARQARLSPSRFAHKFKDETGQSVVSYILRLRIRKAARLLEHGGFSVKETAEQVGFSSPFYFSRQFRQQFFLSPTEYKQSVMAMRGR